MSSANTPLTVSMSPAASASYPLRARSTLGCSITMTLMLGRACANLRRPLRTRTRRAGRAADAAPSAAGDQSPDTGPAPRNSGQGTPWHQFASVSAGREPHSRLHTAPHPGACRSCTTSWDWAPLRALPSEPVTVDIHCVTHWSKLGTAWEGCRWTPCLPRWRPAPASRWWIPTAATPIYKKRFARSGDMIGCPGGMVV
jgi:hypothetical protein